MSNRRLHVRLALTYLEEVVTEVLLEAREQGEILGAAEISRRAGIPENFAGSKKYQGIAYGILYQLEADGRIEKQGRGWGLPVDSVHR